MDILSFIMSYKKFGKVTVKPAGRGVALPQPNMPDSMEVKRAPKLVSGGRLPFRRIR